MSPTPPATPVSGSRFEPANASSGLVPSAAPASQPNSPPPAPAGNSWDSLKVQLRSDLVWREQKERGHVAWVLEDPWRGRFFRIGSNEAEVLRQFDGLRTVSEIQAAADAAGQSNSSVIATMATWACQNGLAHAAGLDGTSRLQGQASALRRQMFWSYLNIVSLRIPLGNPGPWLEKLRGVGHILFSPAAAALWVLTCGTALLYAWRHATELQHTEGILRPGEWLVLLAIWVALKLLHEIGHGLACQRFGGRTGEFGVSLILFTPLAYVDVTSSWRFANRWHRMITSFAGMYVELFLAAVALVVWASLEPDNEWRGTLYKIILASSLTTLLFNANPLMKFDGYYILSDFLQIPNLNGKGTKWVQSQWNHWVFGWPTEPLSGNRQERIWVITYGILATIWRVMVGIGLLIAASVLFKGAGVVLAVIAGVFWYAVPLGRWWQNVRSGSRPPVDYRRLAVVVSVAAGLVALLFGGLSGPTRQVAPAFVRYERETPLRAAEDSVLDQIFVADGERVVAGQKLAVLRNDESQLALRELQAQLEQAAIRSRVHLQRSELALYQAEQERLLRIQEQLRERQQNWERLELKAPFDGFVIARNLTDQVGRFFPAGEVVLTVAENERPELVGSIEQCHLAALQEHHQRFMALLPGLPPIECQLRKLDPRALLTPPHRGLCADAGGPLPIRPPPADSGTDTASSEILTSPRFCVELTLPGDLAYSLRSGQIGQVTFAAPRRSLGAFLYLNTCQWLEQKIADATASY